MEKNFYDLFFFPPDIEERTALQLIEDIEQARRRKKIPRLIFGTDGGCTISGLYIYNVIKLKFPNIVIVATSEVSSAGILILLAAKKENRYITANTRMLMHETGWGPNKNSNKRVTPSDTNAFKKLPKSIQRDMLIDEATYDGIIANETGMTLKKVKKLSRKETFLTDEQIVSHGFAGKMIASIEETT